jgi:hypothetical protein
MTILTAFAQNRSLPAWVAVTGAGGFIGAASLSCWNKSPKSRKSENSRAGPSARKM